MDLELDADTPSDAACMVQLESIDASLRARHGLTVEQTAVGLLDLVEGRLAMIDRRWR